MSGDSIPSESPNASSMDTPAPVAITQDEKLWAMLAHLAGLLGYTVAFGQYVGPLVIYLLYKDKSTFVAFHALQSLYFQLALLVTTGLGVVLAVVTCGLGSFLLIGLAVGAVVYVIVAAIKANQGEWFEYWLVGPWAKRTMGM
jgi:uncharacterized Tic20 family protein